MNLKQTTLASSVLIALVASNAHAAVFVGGAAGQTNTPLALATEQPVAAAESTNIVINAVGNDLVIVLPTIAGYTTSASNTLFYKVALKSGVKFKANPSMLCNTTATNSWTAAALNGGTVTPTQATFSLKTSLRMNQSSAVCKLYVTRTGAAAAAGTGFYTITDKTDKVISAVLEYKDGSLPVTKVSTGTFITFKQTFGIVADANARSTTTAALAKIDVREASKKFTTTKASTTTVALLGRVKATAIATTRLTNTSGAVSITNILSTGFITISGPVNGAAGLNLSNANDCTTNTVGPVAPSGGSVSFNTVTPSNLSSFGLNVCISLNGNNAMEAGQFTLTAAGNSKSGWSFVFPSSPFNLHNITKNGASFRVLNIPNAGNPDQAFIRLYNPNSFDTVARGSLYGQDGTQVGTAQILGTGALKPNEVRVIDAPTLAALFGSATTPATWTGRARLIIDAEADKFFVQALMRGPSQVLVNMSSETASE